MNKLKPKPKPLHLAMTIGDPAGIGAEVVLKSLARTTVRRLGQFTICGHEAILRATWETLSPGKNIRCPLDDSTVHIHAPTLFRGRVPVPGKSTARTGRLSLAYVEAATQMCLAGEVDGMVTAPIAKVAWQRAGCAYPGHTELLAARTNSSTPLMLLSGGGLRVALATIHIPLRAVAAKITQKNIREKVIVLNHAMQAYFAVAAPRIAVLGLNPHAGESGHIGREEITIIRPAVQALRRRGIDVCGAEPADTAFHFALQGRFDAILAMYHDQGLAPLKTIAFDTGVNITLGLPIIRTSVDHGTAFDIAGQGLAREGSCVAAIKTAATMVRAKKRA